MTVRTAELLMASLALLASLALMNKSLELNVGWIPGRGPGSGMWPFWLSVGMALASLATIVRWFLGATPESRSRVPYIERDTVFLVLVTMLALLVLLGLIETVGMYFAVMAFLAFYLKVIGRHTWKVTMSFVLGVPVFIYLLFEVALTKYLPKGVSETEEVLLAIDDVRYTLQYSGVGWWIAGGLAAWALLALAIALRAEKHGANGLLAFLGTVSPVVLALLAAIFEPFGLTPLSLL